MFLFSSHIANTDTAMKLDSDITVDAYRAASGFNANKAAATIPKRDLSVIGGQQIKEKKRMRASSKTDTSNLKTQST